MQHRSLVALLLAAALAGSGGACLASDQAMPADHPKLTPGSRSGTKPAARKPPVDINRASREELKRLPGIGDAEAAKIAAGRPYLSKADLVTRKIISVETYDKLQREIIAKPDEATLRKLKQQGAKQP